MLNNTEPGFRDAPVEHRLQLGGLRCYIVGSYIHVLRRQHSRNCPCRRQLRCGRPCHSLAGVVARVRVLGALLWRTNMGGLTGQSAAVTQDHWMMNQGFYCLHCTVPRREVTLVFEGTSQELLIVRANAGGIGGVQ